MTKTSFTLLLLLLVATPALAVVELDSNQDGKIDSGYLQPWLPSTGPTADNQIIQATGAGVSSWTSIIDGLINDGGTGTDDLWSASKIISYVARDAPVAATSTCTAGQQGYDASYVYVCIATNTWKRAALTTW